MTSSTAKGCPFSHTDFGTSTEPYEHYRMLNEERERSRFLFNDTTERGFLMLQRYDDVTEGFQRHHTWTTHVRSAINPEPGMELLPQDLNGEAHRKLRRVINPFFAPAAVKRMEDTAHQRCVELVEEVKERGECDFVSEFALRYPTDLFLALLGLPVSDGDFFLPWSETVFAGFFGGDPGETAAAKRKIMDYFDQAVRERRANPRDPKEDMVSRLLEARVDGEPISQEDILTICMTLMLAGLDTTRSALGYIYHHLALNDADRQALVDDPDSAPAAAEEFLRLYPLVFQAGREVQEPDDFHGVDLDRGDVVWLGIGSANRDPHKYPDPDRFILGRKGVNQHLAFGAGPHRCLGMHLARLELVVVLREWHKRIPHYRIKDGARPVERGGQLTLSTLPLEWEV